MGVRAYPYIIEYQFKQNRRAEKHGDRVRALPMKHEDEAASVGLQQFDCETGQTDRQTDEWMDGHQSDALPLPRWTQPE